MSELRYHPFLDQWVITATHRQDRTFHPPEGYCPLCPTKPGGFPTEIPYDDYDIAVFENKFPSLLAGPPEPSVAGTELTPVRPSSGVCEVVCYSSNHDATFATLPLSQIKKLARVWKDRYNDLSEREGIEYVFIFENKGKEIGVTLSHPHGQIYAYPFVPPVVRTELRIEREHFNQHERPLMVDVLEDERADGRRIVWENERFVCFVPFFARYPYEVLVTSNNHIPNIGAMNDAEMDDLAEALHTVARKYDALFGFSMPYVMAMHQEPAIKGYDFAWFHVEFYPPYRTADKLKYLAGSEAGAGAFINDTLPEESAARLREV
ncbi:MAG TPA: galactose-1-phosphate uridylyltransferase [Fimbriimonadaceae bacterium]|nr:galactose-1-phosphate uridylyltransferase [Fimbriimonadaceae bacterium]